MITQENFEAQYADPIEQQEIDKFVCQEMSRQIHRYIKAMKGTHQHMLRFEERIQTMTVPERENAIARYIDLNRHAIDGLDLKIVLARAMANYCDTYQYLVTLISDRRRMVGYLSRIREKYIRLHEVFEQDGLFGIRSHDGQVVVSPRYEFLRTPYIYVDDLVSVPVIAQLGGKLGLILADGRDTVVAPFVYDDIELHDEPPYFEARVGERGGFIHIDGRFEESR